MTVALDPSLDLNLLRALDALLHERHVTRAAARLGVTQSAMSHALARLREVVGDPLLVRTSAGMAPTPRAEALAPAIRRALADVADALAGGAAFDPATARARFVIATSDYGGLAVLPALSALLAAAAPFVDVRLRTVPEPISLALADPDIDVVIAPLRPADVTAGMHARRLFDERFVCVVRASHPIAGKRLTLKRFVEAGHVLIAPREREGGFVDDALARLGHARRVAVMVPHFLVAPHVVAATDLILTLARRIADRLAPSLGLAVLAPPPELGLEGFTIHALWHERTHADPARRWLRDRIAEAAAAPPEPPR
jgi:DNA-binding transcriptional LysR family regulator